MASGKLEGMTALITYGSRGIGKAIAELFSDERANMAINFNSSETEALKMKDILKGIEIFKADVSNRVEVHPICRESLWSFRLP
jgi:3-oxoacyl-[acyl-carrier protein] reductase